MKKLKHTNDLTIVGFIASFICGLGVGAIVYCLCKIYNLKESHWYIPFFFLPPVAGAIIYMLSKPKD